MRDEKRHVSQASTAAINISKFIFVVVNLLVPLIVGKAFGIVAERFAYGIVICIISLKYTEYAIALDEIEVIAQEAVKQLKKKMMDHDQMGEKP